ncbi:hypothetical protein [Streptomyces sp. A5-4]|uniref:hypothetical protein n=1 Tax=Streptomyces sp. A5-4 TaxID=3384771 RepID=UPI003DA8910F
MSVFQISCPARVLFLDSELAELHRIEGGGFEVESALYCSLRTGHAGLHHAYTQGIRGTGEVPPQNLWTRWSSTDEYGPLRETLILPRCPASFLEGAIAAECCGLPLDHEGRHGFEFGPPITEADLLPDWLFRLFFPPEE